MPKYGRDWDEWTSSSRKSYRRGLGAKLSIGAACLLVVYGIGVWSGVRLSANQPYSSAFPTSPNPSANSGGGSGATGGLNQSTNGNQNTNTDATSSSPTWNSILPDSSASGNLITQIYQRSVNSIFTITAVTPGTAKTGSEEDIGTGFLINHQGDIATNAHVVNGQSTVNVSIGNQTFKGHVIDADTLDDLAIVHISAPSNMQPLPLGNSATLLPGNLVIAIGNPFQLTDSVSSGIVSGLNRSMPMATGHVMNGLIQTDAVLNPGNSGGPLLNANGQVVGINTAIESPVEGSIGIGFAIPIDRLKQLLPSLLAGQKISHAWLGIAGIDVNSILTVTKKYNFPVRTGVYVDSVAPNSPAAQAGLQGDSASNSANSSGAITNLKGNGDIIVGLDGKPVQSIDQLTEDLMAYQPGQKVTLTIYRNGKMMQVPVTLGNWPANGPQ